MDPLQLRSVATLPILSHPQYLTDHLFKPIILARLGLLGDFNVKNWPRETEQFFRQAAAELSPVIVKAGQREAPAYVKKFDINNTRISAKIASEMWPDIGMWYRDKIWQAAETAEQPIPGLVTDTESILLEPKTETAVKLVYNHTDQEMTTILRRFAERLTTFRFFSFARNVHYDHYVEDLGMDIEFLAELENGMQKEREK